MKRIKYLIAISAAIALTGVGWSEPAAAAGPAPASLAGAPRLDAGSLDGMRGGYVLPSGLVVSFGIERLVAVNGDVVSASRIDVPDLGRITAADAQRLAALDGTRVLQVGQGEILLPGGTAGLVIQNALDGQTIGALTTLDVKVGSLGLFQDLNLASSLQNALIGASTSP